VVLDANESLSMTGPDPEFLNPGKRYHLLEKLGALIPADVFFLSFFLSFFTLTCPLQVLVDLGKNLESRFPGVKVHNSFETQKAPQSSFFFRFKIEVKKIIILLFQEALKEEGKEIMFFYQSLHFFALFCDHDLKVQYYFDPMHQFTLEEVPDFVRPWLPSPPHLLEELCNTQERGSNDCGIFCALAALSFANNGGISFETASSRELRQRLLEHLEGRNSEALQLAGPSKALQLAGPNEKEEEKMRETTNQTEESKAKETENHTEAKAQVERPEGKRKKRPEEEFIFHFCDLSPTKAAKSVSPRKKARSSPSKPSRVAARASEIHQLSALRRSTRGQQSQKTKLK